MSVVERQNKAVKRSSLAPLFWQRRTADQPMQMRRDLTMLRRARDNRKSLFYTHT